jgi:FkbM family methyltransferase
MSVCTRGRDTAFYLRKGFRVVAIEANPEMVAQGRERFRPEIDAGDLLIVDKAIAHAPGRIPFYVNARNTDWCTANEAFALQKARLGSPSLEISVEAVRFADVLQAHGVPYYLKIDIEGNDLECLRALETFETRPHFVSIEASKNSFEEIFEEFVVLWRLGYRCYKIVPQHDVAKQVCPNPPREGRYVQHRFPKGSSGLFGEEVPGSWIRIEAALNRYRSILRRYRISGDFGIFKGNRLLRVAFDKLILRAGWYDTHAKLCD